MADATIVATLMAPLTVGGEELASLPESVKWLEVRADLVGDISPDWLRARFSGNLIYTLRSKAEGGDFDGSPAERRQRLLKFGKCYDLVDLESERDLLTELLDEIPPEKRLISWHGLATARSILKQRLEEFSSIKARFYKLVTMTRKVGDEIAALSLLKLTGRTDVIAYTSGQSSLWSRLLSPYLGAPMIFGTISKQSGDRGEMTVSQLIEDYDLPNLMPLREIYGIVGDPIHHSLSPKLHNAAYRALGYPALFVPFHAGSFSDFWHEIVEEGTLESLGISMKGFTIASPHKESALREVKVTSAMAERAGSTNIFVRNNGKWKADTTDPESVLGAMSRRGIGLSGKKAAVVGCGGSGRAIAAAMDQAGAVVTLVNRGSERGIRASKLLGLPFVLLSEFTAHEYSLVVNATPVGRENGDMPFDIRGLSRDVIIIDLVYGANTTELIGNALAMGRPAVDGREVLYLQVRRQFHLMTGQEMPADLALEILGIKGPSHPGSRSNGANLR